jgi:hypothetical protein
MTSDQKMPKLLYPERQTLKMKNPIFSARYCFPCIRPNFFLGQKIQILPGEKIYLCKNILFVTIGQKL